MIVKNLTADVKEIEVRDITGSRSYKCYIAPYGTADFDKMVFVSPEIPEGVEVDGYINPVKLAPIVPEVAPVEIKTSETIESEDHKEENEEGTAPVIEDKFICEECGAEFASARSLASHKSRSHNK